jgi:hypothetical protein
MALAVKLGRYELGDDWSDSPKLCVTERILYA